MTAAKGIKRMDNPLWRGKGNLLRFRFPWAGIREIGGRTGRDGNYDAQSEYGDVGTWRSGKREWLALKKQSDFAPKLCNNPSIEGQSTKPRCIARRN